MEWGGEDMENRLRDEKYEEWAVRSKRSKTIVEYDLHFSIRILRKLLSIFEPPSFFLLQTTAFFYHSTVYSFSYQFK